MRACHLSWARKIRTRVKHHGIICFMSSKIAAPGKIETECCDFPTIKTEYVTVAEQESRALMYINNDDIFVYARINKYLTINNYLGLVS